MRSVIKHITHPYPDALLMARRDQAIITGQELVERPWWYEDTKTGHLYHDIFGCVGWPSEVSDKDQGMPGYAAIVGIIRPKSLEKGRHYNPADAKFVLLCEDQTPHVPQLIDKCLEMREKYGFGVTPSLMSQFLGDPERFNHVVALKNERLIDQGGEHNALLISPPDDFYTPKIFDQYVRAMRFALSKDDHRFWFGEFKAGILANRINEFRLNDPAVMAAGGLIYSLLNRCMWKIGRAHV